LISHSARDLLLTGFYEDLNGMGMDKKYTQLLLTHQI